MKNFIKNHKIFVIVILILLLFNFYFIMSTKNLSIPFDDIERIEVESVYIDNNLIFTDKNFIKKTVNMLNGYLLKDASIKERKGESSPATFVQIYYKNGKEIWISIYNEGLIQKNEDYDNSTCYKKYGFGLHGKKAAKFFIKYEYLGV